MNNSFNHFQIHALGLCGLCLCLVAGYYLGLRPVWQAQQQLQAIASEGDNLQSLRPSMELELASLTEHIAAKRQLLAEKYSIATADDQPWVGIVTQLLQQRHVELGSLREEPQGSEGGATIMLQITGTYVDLLGLIDDLRRLDRPARISSLNLSPQDERGENCSALVSVRFFPRRHNSPPPPTT